MFDDRYWNKIYSILQLVYGITLEKTALKKDQKY